MITTLATKVKMLISGPDPVSMIRRTSSSGWVIQTNPSTRVHEKPQALASRLTKINAHFSLNLLYVHYLD